MTPAEQSSGAGYSAVVQGAACLVSWLTEVCLSDGFGHSLQVEAELIDKLDSLVSEGKGDENYRELFSLL